MPKIPTVIFWNFMADQRESRSQLWLLTGGCIKKKRQPEFFCILFLSTQKSMDLLLYQKKIKKRALSGSPLIVRLSFWSNLLTCNMGTYNQPHP